MRKIDIGCGTRFPGDYDVYTDIYIPNVDIPGVFVQCPAEKMPFKDKEFDFARANHVIEHTTHPGMACSEIIRIAKEGVITFPMVQAEMMFGRRDHNWYVFIDRGRLLFVKKFHPSLGIPRKDTGCELNNRFTWEGRFEWQVVDCERSMMWK